MHTCLFRQFCLSFNRRWNSMLLTAGSIAILRSRRRHASETVECVARDRGPSADSHALPARAAPLRAAPAETRCRAVRPYGPRPLVPYRRHRGRHRQSVVSPQWPKRSIFAPRGAFGRGGAMFTGGRIRDPMPSGTLTPFPHAMRGRPDHRSASAVPILTGGAGGQNV